MAETAYSRIRFSLSNTGAFCGSPVGVLDSMSYRMVSMKDPDLGFYELCLRLEEKIEELSQGRFGRRRAMIGHLDSILYHRRYCLPKEESDPQERTDRRRSSLPGTGVSEKGTCRRAFPDGGVRQICDAQGGYAVTQRRPRCAAAGGRPGYLPSALRHVRFGTERCTGRGVKIWRLRRTVWCL